VAPPVLLLLQGARARDVPTAYSDGVQRLLPHSNRAVLLATLLLVGGALGGGLLTSGCARRTPPTNVLLIVVDTLRADRLGRAGLTPELDLLAAESIVFKRAQSPRAKTTPAVASLLTGLYPHDHGVRDLTTPLARDVPVVAEAFKAGGYRTGAIVGNYVLRDELSGLARGFDLWVEDLPNAGGVPPSDVALRKAGSLTDGALCALGLGAPAADGAGPSKPLVKGDAPWFLWLHYMDPHGLYDPPEPYRSQALEASWDEGAIERVPPPKEPREGSVTRQWVANYNVPAEARLPDGGIDAGRARALYDGEVRHVDAQLGRLLRELREAGLLENTLVVICADHGESLGEHDYWFEHGRYAYEATCRVPLMVRFPDGFRDRPEPGKRESDISLPDLFPTLIDVLRLPRMASLGRSHSMVRGRSRALALMEDSGPAEAVFCEKIERAEKARAIQSKAARIGDWKLIRRYTHLVDPDHATDRRLVVLSEELYDLAADPAEEANLIRLPPARAPLADLQRELLEFSKADQHFAELARILQARREELGREDPETLRVLKALGY
jgi:arylsulfatase A-like enzyme